MSEQHIVLVFMILTALLIWFLSTEIVVNFFFLFFTFLFLFLFVRKSLSYFQVKQ